MKKFLCVCCAWICLSASLCSCEGIRFTGTRFSDTFYDVFDTASTVVAYEDSQAAFDEHLQAFHDRLKEYDRLYDIYHGYDGLTNLKTVNENAAQAPVTVDGKIMDLLRFAKEMYTLTDGKTNVAFGAVLRLWHDAREYAGEHPESARLPDSAALAEAAAHTDIDDLILDEDASTVYFADPALQLDVGAVAKGYAVREVCRWAAENLWRSAAVSIGGNVVAIGAKKDDGRTPWNIQLENPYDDGTSAETVQVTDLAVVTSAGNQRYFTVDGKNYCHIINPDTLYPSAYTASVTVICEDSALADALSTALFNMPPDEGMALIESLDGAEALWQTNEHEIKESSGFALYRG